MRGSSGPSLLGALVILLAVGACGSPTAPTAVGDGSSSAAVPTPTASAGAQGSWPTQTPTKPAWVPTAKPPKGDFVVRGIDTDQPCTATQDGGAPVALGIALHEVADLTVDPSDAGPPGDTWTHESMFLDNFELGTGWPEGCEAAVALGRVTGHMQNLTNYEAYRDGVATPQVITVVHLFQTPEGAEAYVNWVPEAQPWPCLLCTGGSVVRLTGRPQTEPLEGAGPGAVLVHMRGEDGDRDVALVRHGAIVGEVIVVGRSGHLPEVDIADLARQQAARIVAAEPTGKPYDVMQVMSAPLPVAAWPEDLGAHEWDLNYAGGRDNWEYVQMAQDPEEAAADLKEYARLVSYQANFSPPPWVATALTLYEDSEHARAALRDVIDDRLAGIEGSADPATQWEVDGLPGSVGLTFYTGRAGDRQLATEVWLRRGASVDRVYIVVVGNGSVAEEREYRAMISEMAKQWAPRLDAVLGAR